MAVDLTNYQLVVQVFLGHPEDTWIFAKSRLHWYDQNKWLVSGRIGKKPKMWHHASRYYMCIIYSFMCIHSLTYQFVYLNNPSYKDFFCSTDHVVWAGVDGISIWRALVEVGRSIPWFIDKAIMLYLIQASQDFGFLLLQRCVTTKRDTMRIWHELTKTWGYNTYPNWTSTRVWMGKRASGQKATDIYTVASVSARLLSWILSTQRSSVSKTENQTSKPRQNQNSALAVWLSIYLFVYLSIHRL